MERQLSEARATIQALQEELAETNRGLVALMLELEQRVDERTAQLRAAQEELQKTNSELLQLTLELEQRVADHAKANEDLSAEIEQHRLTEVALQKSEGKFRAVTETAADAIVSADQHGHITYFNPGAARIFNYAAEEVLGKPLTLLMPKRFHEAHRQGLVRFLRTGEARVVGRTIELVGQRKEGAEFPLELSLASWEASGDTFFTGILRDITERKQAEEELKLRGRMLEAANKELEAFSYSVSHDLRAPLRHIDGFSELLGKHAATLDEKGRRYLKTISESAKQMGTLIDDLLQFSRIGRAELRKDTISLDQLVKESLASLKQDMDGRKIMWTIDALPDIHGDPVLLRQVFVNLLSNAVKYTRGLKEAKIEIGTLPSDGAAVNGQRSMVNGGQNRDEVVIYVRDNGAGFDPQYAHKLFGVFQRLHATHEFEGTGIGLANVKRIIDRHGGRVWAKGKVNEGATFYVALLKTGNCQ